MAGLSDQERAEAVLETIARHVANAAWPMEPAPYIMELRRILEPLVPWMKDVFKAVRGELPWV